MQRAFVYKNAQALKALMVLECGKVNRLQATVPAHIKLVSLKPGMVFCLGEGREPDRSTSRTIAAVKQAKTGASTIKFDAPPVGIGEVVGNKPREA